MIRVVLPQHLRTPANVGREVQLDVTRRITQRWLLDALVTTYPMFRGTIRDRVIQQRRPLVRFFACEEDGPRSCGISRCRRSCPPKRSRSREQAASPNPSSASLRQRLWHTIAAT